MIVLIILLSLVPTAKRGETTYYFGADELKTNISFEGKTDVATISGSSHKASGSVTLDMEAGTGSCALSVPVDSLNSGMDARDRVMRSEAWLDAAKHPKIEFKAEKGTLTAKPFTWTVPGKFTLHGVTRELSITAEVKAISAALAEKAKLGAGSWVRVRTEFKIKLSDFGIKVPDRSQFTVDDTWSITINLFGTTQKPPEEKSETKKPDDEEGSTNAVKAKPVTLEGVEGTRYKFGGKPQFTNIAAVSETEAETLKVTTNTLAGLAAIDFAKGTGKIKLSIPVASLKTGVEKRDEELHGEKGLDAAKYPDIFFESTKCAKKDDKTWSLEGTISMHGKTVSIAADVVLAELSQELVKASGWANKPGIKLKTAFALKLSDFGITAPESSVKLTVDLLALKE